LRTTDTMVVEHQLVLSWLAHGEGFAVLVDLVRRRTCQFEAVEQRNRLVIGIGRIDLQPAAVPDGLVETVAKRYRRGGDQVQDGGVDTRAFGSAGTGARDHGAVPLDIRRPTAAVDIEIGKEPAMALQITLYFCNVNTRAGI